LFVAIIECPGCGKGIDVPQSKLGRWIACPACKMEFAALADNREEDEEMEDLAREVDEPHARSVSLRQLVVPLGLLLVVAVVGILAYVAAKSSSRAPGGRDQAPAVASPAAMPPVDRHVSAESPLGLPGLQPGPLDSMLGIGSSIKSFLWWSTVLTILFLVSSIGMLIWMARDSRNRGMESVASWITPVLLTNILGFSLYMLARPKGQLVNCRHCNNRCLENASNCPHCRRSKPTRKKRPKLEDWT
jgi:hypothetical protein